MAALGAGLALAACSSTVAAPSGDVTAAAGIAPVGETVSTQVVRVVDGDTVRVVLDGRETPVRLIGIDAPESVKPDAPVDCFGPEASEFATALLDGRPVTLEFDEGQGRTDRYDRVLAYVWIEDDDGALALVNLAAVDRGYARAREYSDIPTRWGALLAEAQATARAAGAGLWGACAD